MGPHGKAAVRHMGPMPPVLFSGPLYLEESPCWRLKKGLGLFHCRARLTAPSFPSRRAKVWGVLSGDRWDDVKLLWLLLTHCHHNQAEKRVNTSRHEQVHAHCLNCCWEGRDPKPSLARAWGSGKPCKCAQDRVHIHIPLHGCLGACARDYRVPSCRRDKTCTGPG